jgi:arylsulfatase A-like enzyme
MPALALPNFVVIVSDTFRRDHVGAYGNPSVRTPYLDEFARSAVVMKEHLISSFPTMPARADLLTGSFSFSHMGWEPLPAHLPTLPEILSGAGYHTMGVVDTPFFIRNGFGYDRGFDDFVWVRGQGDDTRPRERVDVRSTWRYESDRMVARTVTEAERWLERHYRESFFLYVDTWDPHEPWDAPEYYTSLYREGYGGEQIHPCYGKYEQAGLSAEDVELAHATYCGEVTMVDLWLGRLLAKLDVLGLRENTWVLFTSDHGFYFGEHGYFGKAEWVHDPEATLSQGSLVPAWLSGSWLLTLEWSPLYGEITRVPLLIRGPGLEAGSRTALTTAPDIAPTVLELAGLQEEQRASAMAGESFVGVLEGKKEEHRPFVVSSWPLYFAEGELTMAVDSRVRRIASYMPLSVTTSEWSLILGGPDDEPELYELGTDPQEKENIWHREKEEGLSLMRRAISFLELQGTPERHLAPRRSALRRLASGRASATDCPERWRAEEAG